MDIIAIQNLIDHLYKSESLLHLRTNFLKLILPLLNADGAIFFLVDKDSQTLNLNSGISNGLDPYYFEPYKEYYKNYEPFREAVYSNLICATEKILPESLLKTKEYREFMNDFLRPQKLQHELMLCIRSESELYGKIGVFKRINMDDFTERDLEVALLLEKHLEYIMKNMNLKEELIKEANFEFPYMGILVLDYALNIVRINLEAQQICYKIAGQQFLHAPANKDIPLPREIVLDCQTLKQKFQEGKIIYPSLPIVNNIGNDNYHRFVSRSYIEISNFDVPSFFVLLEDSEIHQKMTEESAAHKYKLTTRELQICMAIKDGLTNNEISDMLYINLSTVETHIRNIFRKTEAKNRTELVKLLNFE